MPPALEDIDIIRERMRVGYRQAKEALDAADGNVVDALAAVEAEQSTNSATAAIESIIEEVKGSLNGRQIDAIRINLGDETVKEVPVALAGVGGVLLTLISALLAYLTIEVITSGGRDSKESSTTQPGAKLEVQNGKCR